MMDPGEDPTRFCPGCEAIVQSADPAGRKMQYTCGSRVEVFNQWRRDFFQSGACKAQANDTTESIRELMGDVS